MRLAAKLLVLALTFAPVSYGEENGKVFVFVRDGSRNLDLMLTQEVGVMTTMLKDAGYTVDIATASGDAMKGDMYSLTPTVTLDEVQLGDYVGVVLPCMAPARGFDMPERVTELTREALELDIPIAASRGSVEALAEAGALVERRYAYASAVNTDERPEFAAGLYQGTGVVRDGTISTAGICPLASRSLGEPDGTVELMDQFIASLRERS